MTNRVKRIKEDGIGECLYMCFVRLSIKAGMGLKKFHRCGDGQALVEYVMMSAVITLSVAVVLAPGGDLGIYDLLRSIYRRALVIISLPTL